MRSENPDFLRLRGSGRFPTFGSRLGRPDSVLIPDINARPPGGFEGERRNFAVGSESLLRREGDTIDYWETHRQRRLYRREGWTTVVGKRVTQESPQDSPTPTCPSLRSVPLGNDGLKPIKDLFTYSYSYARVSEDTQN